MCTYGGTRKHLLEAFAKIADPYGDRHMNCTVAFILWPHLLHQKGQQRWQLRLAGALEDAVLC
jgi:hypothetical protein